MDRGLAGTEAEPEGRLRMSPNTRRHLSTPERREHARAPSAPPTRLLTSACLDTHDRILAASRGARGGGRLGIRVAADWTRLVREAG